MKKLDNIQHVTTKVDSLNSLKAHIKAPDVMSECSNRDEIHSTFCI
jgi:alpha-N-acetylglucosamine transferase